MTASPQQYLRLDLEIAVPYSIVLEGLDAWFEWDLISEVDFKWRSNRSSANRLTVVAIQNERILQGLDLWLELGLIKEKSVKLICETRFVCDIKAKATELAIASHNLPIAEPNRQLANISGSRLPRSTIAQVSVKPKTLQEPSKVVQTVRSLFSEFSTMWLLFLGVFLVVVSSGLLAASQWDNFSPQVQYLLLLAYTLGFFGVSFWTSKNERLRMTTRALQLVTLLLVPANFWAMDGLGLLKNPAGMGLSAIAGCLLSGIAVFLLQTSFVFRDPQVISQDATIKKNKKQLSQISILAILLLGWLHLGWFLSSYYPLIAVYLGISGLAVSTFLNRRQGLNTADSSTFPLALITGAYSTVLLISRALLFGNVSVFKLGLAFGVCGWVLVQITNKTTRLRSPSDQSADTASAIAFQSNLGQILLGLGWLVSVWDRYPWQTFTVSLLIAWLLCDRLLKLEDPIDLTYLFFWGLQLLWLGCRLIPEDWRLTSTQQFLTFFQTNSELNLLGILLFPYLIVALIVAAIYRDRQKNALATRGELLALGFGVLLTILSIGYPLTIFVNLSLSAIALSIVQAKRSPNSKDLHSLVYFAHIISISAIVSGIFFYTRSTSIFAWVGFLLAMMLIEWSAVLVIGKFSTHPQIQVLSKSESQENILLPSLSGRGVGHEGNPHLQAWRDSAWHIGASLAALSYILLWNSLVVGQNLGISSESLVTTSYWGVAWLSVPISLTLLGTWREFADRDLAIKLSIAGLVIAQFLTWGGDGSRVISLGVAFALMLVNTRRSESLLTTFNTVGYGLLFIASLLWQFKFGDGAIAQLTFGINGAIVSVLLLYILNHWLKYRRDRHVPDLNLPLNQSYSQAFDIWAALLSAALLILQSFLAVSVFAFNYDDQLFINLLPSTILVTLGLVYRIWQSIGRDIVQAPPFWTEWGIAWGIELLTSGAIAVTNGSVIELAIANITLGFLTQLLGDWWMKRTGNHEYPRSWHIIPLIYGVMGSLFRIGTFSNLSGLFSLSTSLIGIGIGRRASQSNPVFKTLTYISMAIATFSAYELLFYQMVANSKGGSFGDGFVLLATLGCAIAYAYKIFANWIVQYLRISIKEVGISAHLHWTASAIFLLLGSFSSPSTSGGAIGGFIAIALSAYAIAQGKTSLASLKKGGKDLESSDIWIYTGITTIISAIAYLIYFAFPNPWLIANLIQPYAAAIACIFAAILYLPPWEEWGWAKQPWRNSAFALPLIFTGITGSALATPCLIIVGIFYAIYAKLQQQIRMTYITVLLWDWAILQNVYLNLYEVSRFNFLIYASVIGFSGLYFAQVEPTLRSRNSKALRHALRSLLSGGIGLIAYLYSFDNPSLALSTWILSFIFIIAGLGLRVRAYLFMGTLTFILLVLTQAVILVTQYSFLMWALGIIAGIGFILVAANFEVRRDRILALFRNVAIELETWE
ncbi:MAG: hypothetical protein DCF19_23160 [Pseudanabaena frigida]|uniref:DUF2157 domain-containing protein n=1 Tax=Pseudanabaena frigida TaxID=945775 RepID=A0A2W4VUX2_9CYAN|nr:MAG: hypothetical protein DCF19_23160 [Pseudanabaena frigida]